MDFMDFDRKIRTENVVMLAMAADNGEYRRATTADLRVYVGASHHNAFLDALVS